MTEDEAFIRTIVDRPGDDLPRLVYADWLDERGDRRGAYLRAEVEWAKTKQTTGFIVLRLNGLAEGLDPVWVVCVSRPPLGVCCDHLRFTNCGPRVPLSEVHYFERRVGFGLPNAFRAFLVNYNAGQLIPPVPAPEPAHEFEGNPVLCLSPLLHSYKALHEEIAKLEDGVSYYAERGYIRIGYNASELSYLLIGITAANAGQLFSNDSIRSDMAFGGHPPQVASDLPRFLAGLAPRWERVRNGPYDI